MAVSPAQNNVALVKALRSGNIVDIARLLPEKARRQFAILIGADPARLLAQVTKSDGTVKGMARLFGSASQYKPKGQVELVRAAIRACERTNNKDMAAKIMLAHFLPIAKAEIPKRGFRNEVKA